MSSDASTEEETAKPKVAYARFPQEERVDFREDWLA